MLRKKSLEFTRYIWERCNLPQDQDLFYHIQMRVYKQLSEAYMIGRADHADGVQVMQNLDGFVSHLSG